MGMFGKVFCTSECWRDLFNSTIFKFFVEYYDSHASQSAFERISVMDIPGDFKVKVDFCSLFHEDRYDLFFMSSSAGEKDLKSTSSSKRSSPTNSSKCVIINNNWHQYSNSTMSGLSSFSEDSRLETRSQASNQENISSANDGQYNLELEKIALGQDQRTTCMIKNIPNKYTQQMLIDFLDESHRGRYDFIYLRMDFKNKCNVGYAFINFVSPR